jgi:hypothetical protein
MVYRIVHVTSKMCEGVLGPSPAGKSNHEV